MFKKVFSLFTMLILCIGLLSCTAKPVYAYNRGSIGLSFKTHFQNVGWIGPFSSGGTANPGSGLHLEAITMSLTGAASGLSINYRAHVQDIGWMSPVRNGAMAGTTGQNKKLEAIGIWLTGPGVFGYNVRYQVYVEGLGWLPEVDDGMNAGTTGQARAITAIKISITYRDKYIYVGNFGVADYSNYNCPLWSLSRVYDLSNEINTSFSEHNTQAKYLDSAVTRGNFFNVAPQKDLVFYMGHGYSDFIHISSNHPKDDETYPYTLISKGDFINLGLGINNGVDYLHLQTCHMLEVQNETLYRMLGSMKMILGYASRMQMYPGQMLNYINGLEAGKTMWDSWVLAGQIAQQTHDEATYAARVFDDSYYYATLNNIDERKPAPYPNNAPRYQAFYLNPV